MKIIQTYSHLNGLEFLLVHQPGLWEEIQSVIASVDALQCKVKVSREKTMKGRLLYSPIEMNISFKSLLQERGWQESRVQYWVTGNERLMLALPATQVARKECLTITGTVPATHFSMCRNWSLRGKKACIWN